MARLRSENPDIPLPRRGRPARLASLRLQDRWADWHRTPRTTSTPAPCRSTSRTAGRRP